MYKVDDVIDEKYLVVEELGAGGMGAVVRVVDGAGEEFALKYCTSDEPANRKRFAREVRVMERIDHPNVVQVVDSNVHHDPPYFVMPVAVGSLNDELQRFKGDEEATVAAIRQVCEGVEAIHAAGATHRDLKPLNVLRMPGGELAVSDMGLAKFNERDTTIMTTTTTSLGTFAYAAPEQFAAGGSRDADERTDVFQLGRTLYELMTNELPFAMDLRRLDPGLAHIIEHATKHDPKERYESVSELLDALTNYEVARDPGAHPATAFDALVADARKLLGKGKVDRANVQRIAHAIAGAAGDHGGVIEMFEKLPDELLPAIATTLPVEAEELARHYCEAVTEVISGYGFGHAEIVAVKMYAMFRHARTPSLRATAIEATLIAAVSLNRFAAMETFDVMLKDIKQPQDAVAVAGMLQRRMGYYKSLAARLAPRELHVAIQRVQAVAKGEMAVRVRRSASSV